MFLGDRQWGILLLFEIRSTLCSLKVIRPESQIQFEIATQKQELKVICEHRNLKWICEGQRCRNQAKILKS